MTETSNGNGELLPLDASLLTSEPDIYIRASLAQQMAEQLVAKGFEHVALTRIIQESSPEIDLMNLATNCVRRSELEDLLKTINPPDREEFDQLRLEYGAKSAHLIQLAALLPQIDQLYQDKLFGTRVAIPLFQAVPAELYQRWKTGEKIDDDLNPIYEWIQQLNFPKGYENYNLPSVLVRSSAVYAEDGEHNTGAGIYETCKMPYKGSFEDFKACVLEVYKSVDSPRAVAYRHQYGIETESMGLTIMQFVDPTSRAQYSRAGYTHATLPGVRELINVSTNTCTTLLNRQALDWYLSEVHIPYLPSPNHFHHNVYHYPPDIGYVAYDLPVRVAMTNLLLEKIWGEKLDIEYCFIGNVVNIFQLRPSPAV